MGIFKKILYKIFRLEPDIPVCLTCEVLMQQLSHERTEKDRLFQLLMNKEQETIIKSNPDEELTPLRNNTHIPFRTRQQLTEAEDRRTLELMQEHNKRVKAAKTTGAQKEVKIPGIVRAGEKSTDELEKEVLGEQDAS